MKDLIRSSNPEVVASWHQICDAQEREKTRWVADLRKCGFKAAHPNDGWVDREKNTLQFVYPHFDDGAGVDDLVMLGQSFTKPGELRPIRLTGTVKSFFSAKIFTFEDASTESSDV